MTKQVTATRMSELWHQHVGHPSSEAMSFIAKDLDLHKYVRKENNVCDICLRAKQTRTQFHVSENKVEDLFQIIHSDIWDLIGFPPHVENTISLTVVNDASGGVWLYLMKEKSEVKTSIKWFVAMAISK